MTERIFLRQNNTVIITDLTPSGYIVVNWYAIEPFEKYSDEVVATKFKWLGVGFRDWINENKIPYISHGLILNRQTKPAVYMIHNQRTVYKAWYSFGKIHRSNGPACIRWDSDGSMVYSFRRYDVEIDDQVKEWQRKNNIPDWPNWTKDHQLLYKLKFM